MDVKRSLISLCLSFALGGALVGVAVAKTAEDEDSVRSWGRWAVLSPAAGADEYVAFAPEGISNLGRCDTAANCPTPNPEPTPDEGPCVAGQPCGFAYIDHLVRGEGQGDDSHMGRFELTVSEGETDTVAFRVTNTDEGIDIQSDTLPALFTDTGFRSNDRTSPSLINGRVTELDADEAPAVIEGFWRQNADDGSFQQNGEYVIGITATAAELSSMLDEFGGADRVAYYQGPTGRGGDVWLRMDFGQSTWSGEFAGQQVSFDAGGAIIGSGFVSDPGSFSGNIASGAVEGGFVNAGQNAIGAFEVTDLEGMHDADIFNAGLAMPD